MLSRVLLVTALSFTSLNVYAEDHPLGPLTGEDGKIDLKTQDHTLAGSVRDFVVWGVVDEATFTSELRMRRDGQTVVATFKKGDDGKIGGVIKHDVDGRFFETALAFTKFDGATATFELTANGEPVRVQITAEGVDGHHWVNPTFTATLASGEEVSFRMQGQACPSYSLHLIFLVLGAWLH